MQQAAMITDGVSGIRQALGLARVGRRWHVVPADRNGDGALARTADPADRLAGDSLGGAATNRPISIGPKCWYPAGSVWRIAPTPMTAHAAHMTAHAAHMTAVSRRSRSTTRTASDGAGTPGAHTGSAGHR